MAITEMLRLLITADSQGAVRGLEQVGKAADRELSRSEQSLDRWGHRLTSVGSGLIAFGAVAAYGLGQAAASAGELEQAVGGTEAVFKEASGVIDDYAANAADKVGLSEAAFRTATTSIGGQLKRMGVDVDTAAAKSIELTEVAADLAATYGGTTAEAVEALGSAFRGEADPAERFNLDLRVSKVNAEAVALGLATSTSAVADHARAQAILSLVMKQSADASGQFGRESDTLQGRQQRLSAEFENLKASIGEGVLPVMETLFDVASKGVGVFSGLNDATGGALGQLATVTTVASLGIGGLSLLVGQAIKTREALGSMGQAARAAGAHLAGMRGSVVSAGIQLGVLAIGMEAVNRATAFDHANLSEMENALLNFGRTGEVTGELASAAGDDLGTLRDAIAEVADPSVAEQLDHTMSQIGNTLSFGMGVGDTKNLQDAKAAIDDVDKALAQLAARDPEAAAASFDALAGALEEQGIDAATTRGLLDDYQAALAEIDTTDAVSGTDDLGGAMEGAAGSTDNATTALQTYQDQLQALFDPLWGAIDAAHNLRDANQEVADKTVALAEAEATYGAGSAEATAAAIALSDAQTAASMAAQDQESALLALKDAVVNEGLSVDEAKRKLAEWVAQGAITQESADATARELDGVTWSMGAIPDGKSIDIHVTGTQYTIGQLDAIAERVNALSDGSFHISRGGGGGQTFHTGGIVPGPRGQEVDVTVLAGERVLSLAEVDRMSGAGRMMPAAMMGHSSQGQTAQAGGPQGVTIQQMNVNTSDSPRQWLDEIPWRLAS